MEASCVETEEEEEEEEGCHDDGSETCAYTNTDTHTHNNVNSSRRELSDCIRASD